MRSLADEVPFDIPDSWEWVRLGNIGDWGAGATPSRTHPEYYGGNIPWLKTGDLTDSYIDAIPETITELALEKTSVRLNPAGSVLIAMYGATIGKLGILSIAATTNQACCACFPLGGLDNKYLFYFLMAQKPLFIKQGEGGAQPNISKEKIVSTLMPVPPLEEQRRIVVMLGRIFPIIDVYSKCKTELDLCNTTFPERLKKSILQEAVQGKLVPQDPSDEPAEALLERIRAEKQRLIKEGKIRKDKHESVIFRRDNSHYEKRGSEEVCIDDEIPFEIPENWAWCRFETATLYVTDYVANGSFASLRENVKTYKEENYALMVKTQDFSNDFTRGLTYTDQKGFDYLQKSRLYGGELMLSNIGASIGKAFIVPAMNIRMTLAPNAIVVKCLDAIMTEYLRYFILSYYGQKMLSDFTAGTAMPKFSKTQLRSALIPVPPYSEQRRIIEKIKQLDVLVCTL